LSFAKGDKSKLEQLVSIAEELEPTDFIEESYNVMAQVLEDAKKILQDEDALEKEVQDTYDTLYEAMVSLECVAEKTTLNSAIAKAETNLNLYMTDGKEAFKRALAAAKRVAVDSNVSQEKVDRATEALTEAMAALRKLADKTQLEELLHRANTINLSGYTSSSVSQFKAACNVLEGQPKRSCRRRSTSCYKSLFNRRGQSETGKFSFAFQERKLFKKCCSKYVCRCRKGPGSA
jgi:hypothetical protein